MIFRQSCSTCLRHSLLDDGFVFELLESVAANRGAVSQGSLATLGFVTGLPMWFEVTAGWTDRFT